MIRGTTPTLEFHLPFNTEILVQAWVTLSQNGEVIIDKKLDDCDTDATKLSTRLTQEETLKLDHNYITEIQVRVRTKADDALASDIIRVSTDRILKDGVI